MKNELVPLLKGVAIIGVVLTHILSSLPGVIFTTSKWSWFFVGLDQTLRFCVPLFLALSGYALARKYHFNSFELGEFLRRRLWKLLPLYVVWSVILMIVLSTVPEWRSSGGHVPIWLMILMGGADYHLYFIPMIFQLYILFPLFWFVMKIERWRLLLVVCALLSQVILFGYINTFIGRNITTLPFILSDQGQYLAFTSWWGYFLVGMLLAFLPRNLTELRRRWQVAVVLLLVLCWVWVIRDARMAILHGLDPLYALRFTRWPVIAYASLFTIVAVSGIDRWQRWLVWWDDRGVKVRSLLLWTGQYSFLIYLSHTLFLRLIFSTHSLWSKVQLPMVTWVGVLAVAVSGWIVSVWLQKKLGLAG